MDKWFSLIKYALTLCKETVAAEVELSPPMLSEIFGFLLVPSSENEPSLYRKRYRIIF